MQRILVVEDDPTLARVVCRALMAAGYEVHQAHDGVEGLLRLDEDLFDAVVSDVNMPRLTGLDLLEQASRFHPNLPVVLMTAELDAAMYGRARDMGSVRYLLKPISAEQLTHAVECAVKLGTAWRRSYRRKAAGA